MNKVMHLPYPPTVNTYWRMWRNRMVISKNGRQYRKDITVILAGIGVERQLGRLRVTITIYPPDKRRRDLDNICKALLDGMAHGGVYDDDSQIDDLRIIRGDTNKAHPHVVVNVETI